MGWTVGNGKPSTTDSMRVGIFVVIVGLARPVLSPGLMVGETECYRLGFDE